MSFWKRFKSSITGLFVKQSYAVENPATTFSQRVPKAKSATNKTGAAAVKRSAAKKKSAKKKR